VNPIPEVASAPPIRFHGLDLPARFGEPARELETLRAGAALFDASLRAWVRMRGEDRVDFLQGMVSNDVRALGPGAQVYAALLTQQGRVVSDLRIHAAADHFLLDLPAHVAGAAIAALEKYIVADDVELEPVEAVLVGLEGPRAAAVLAAAAGTAAPTGLAAIEIAGQAVTCAPGGVAGGPGLVLGVAAAGATAVWQALRAAGAEPVGFEAIEVARVEAGIPWVGVDMDEEILVMEADLDSAISFKKGCYLGQEVVERVAARGHINRKRVGLLLGADPVAPGTKVQAGEQEVGWVTSSVRSPRLGRAIAMGYVRREHFAPGTALRAGAAEAVVAELPFVRC